MGCAVNSAGWSNVSVDLHLHSVADVMANTNDRLISGQSRVTIWPTGYEALDEALGGGLRGGSLTLLAGPQGLGKTTFALQLARNSAVDNQAVVYFCYEHEPQYLLERLVALEAGEIADFDAPTITEIRSAFEGRDGEEGDLATRLRETVGGVAALHRLAEYADTMHLHRSTGAETTLDVIKEVVARVRAFTGKPPLVVVDYLQKVSVPGADNLAEDEQVTIVVEGLKDLAIEERCPIFAIVAGDKEGIEVGKRMRAVHMRGSTALAYEPDVLLLLNNKVDVVARHHLVYDVNNMDKFRQWVVLTIEKNRLGRDHIDLEFQSRFEQSRFESAGRIVSEKLVDERVYTE
jgi:replicative DNA helicase